MRPVFSMQLGMVFVHLMERSIIRFLAFVKPANGCLEWTGSRVKTGYGTFSNNGTIRAHRFIYEFLNGKQPPGICICHKCDNPPCVNPDHLFLATQLENIKDRVNKGRSSRGETHPHSKLTPNDVLEIRSNYIPNVVSMRKLAKKYGVTCTTIMCVLNRKTWK